MTRRKLTPEEIELWRKVTEQTEALSPERSEAKPTLPKPKPTKAPIYRPGQFSIGQNNAAQLVVRHDPIQAISERLAAAPVGMDHKTYRKMARGKLTPEGRIDLHGMTLDQAHTALTRFILRSQAKTRRLVLVITGKGRTSRSIDQMTEQRGLLRQQVPQWLTLPPLSQAVLQVRTAHKTHGGDGAYYVYLRRGR